MLKISKEQIEFMKNASDHVDRLCGGRGYGKTHQLIKEMEGKINQLQSNWNSLRELLESEKKAIEEDELFCYLSNKDYIEFILDKMNELESGEKN